MLDDAIYDALSEDERAIVEQLAADEDALANIVFGEGVDVRPETDDELHAYIRTYYGYDIPRAAVCPGHCSPFDAVSDVFFNRYPDENPLWTGGRGSGKTLPFAILEHLMLHFDGDEIVNVGAIEEQAQKCYSYIVDFCGREHFRGDMKKPPMLSKSFWRNGGKLQILPGTKRAVNGPHPRVSMFDEVDLMPWDVLQEGWNMSITQRGKPPQIVLTSSLKFAYGPMIRLMREAKQRAIRTYTWCVFESIEQCPETRHKNGVGCETCPLAKECLEEETDDAGNTTLAPGPGKAARARGFMPIDEVIKKYRGLDKDTWDSQMRSKKPSTKGLVYPAFDRNIHVVEYDYNPALPVYEGIDFGYTNPSAVISIQVTPDGYLVAFDEIYRPQTLNEELAEMIKRRPWFGNTLWRMGDPAAAEGRATLNKHGVMVSAADNTKDTSKDESGISKVRWLLSPRGYPRPLLYVASRCVNLINEFETYHVPDQKEELNAKEQPEKADDHALDALRYAVARLIRTTKKK